MDTLSDVIVACWAIFWVGWIISAFYSKRSIGHINSQFLRARLYMLVVAIVIIHFVARAKGVNYGPILSGTTAHLIGVLLFVSGLALAIWARTSLGKNWGMPMTQKQDPELVTSGPYKYIRHPIYSGILIAVIGSILASSIFWIFVFIIQAPFFIYSCFYEDRLMLKTFPKVYPEYKARTKMLIPFIF